MFLSSLECITLLISVGMTPVTSTWAEFLKEQEHGVQCNINRNTISYQYIIQRLAHEDTKKLKKVFFKEIESPLVGWLRTLDENDFKCHTRVDKRKYDTLISTLEDYLRSWPDVLCIPIWKWSGLWNMPMLNTVIRIIYVIVTSYSHLKTRRKYQHLQSFRIFFYGRKARALEQFQSTWTSSLILSDSLPPGDHTHFRTLPPICHHGWHCPSYHRES